ncbi:MAG TPA: SDR family NAD(P)-dependent oxidoreductase [Polyangiales bacterium]|jgi:short-subunit dehydrogenase
MRALKGKTALITGASRGLGRELARALANRGMKLALAARSVDDLAALQLELEGEGAELLCVPTDVADRASLEALVEQVSKRFGPIALLINNAALEQGARYPEYPRDGLQQILDVNLRAPMLLTHMLLPQMIARGEGHVVNIGSVAGLVGVAYNEAYAATKHGLVGFTRSLAASAEGEGWPIGFSCILPGFVGSTGMYEDMKRQTGFAAPWFSGVSSPARVVAATLRAIERDRLEVVVSVAPFRLLAIFLLLCPSATKWALRLSGSIAWFKAVASARRSERQANDRSRAP